MPLISGELVAWIGDVGPHGKCLVLGNVLDEGTDFAPTNVADASGIQPYYDCPYHIHAPRSHSTQRSSHPPPPPPLTSSAHYPTSGTPDLNSALNTALGLYPDDPTQGCPYNPTDASPSDRFYGSTNQFKRLASLVGDFVFHGSMLSIPPL